MYSYKEHQRNKFDCTFGVPYFKFLQVIFLIIGCIGGRRSLEHILLLFWQFLLLFELQLCCMPQLLVFVNKIIRRKLGSTDLAWEVLDIEILDMGFSSNSFLASDWSVAQWTLLSLVETEARASLPSWRASSPHLLTQWVSPPSQDWYDVWQLKIFNFLHFLTALSIIFLVTFYASGSSSVI